MVWQTVMKEDDPNFRGGIPLNDFVMRKLPRQYETTLDRAGLALVTGGGLGGLVVLLLVVAGGQRDPLALMTALVLGTVFTMLGVTAVGAPLWLVMHLSGYRRGWHAAALGALLALIVFVAGQTYGFGFAGAPVTDGRTLFLRWLSALATSGLLAVVAAAIGYAMWRVAYRRVL